MSAFILPTLGFGHTERSSPAAPSLHAQELQCGAPPCRSSARDPAATIESFVPAGAMPVTARCAAEVESFCASRDVIRFPNAGSGDPAFYFLHKNVV